MPVDFITSFENSKRMEPGDMNSAPREVQDEARIRFLQKQIKEVGAHHTSQMKELELKLRSKIEQYGKEQLDTMILDFKKEIKLLIVQQE